jgi:membrane protein implicated in regulation of membrane protease activity
MSRKSGQDFFLFLIGGALFAAGIFLFTSQVMVGSGSGFGLPWGRGFQRGTSSFLGGFFNFGVGEGFGLLMIPFGLGVALLLADVMRKLGWFLVWASSAAVAAAILQSLFFSFRPTSLWSLMSMVVMIAGGAGLMFKSLRDYRVDDQESRQRDRDESRQSVKELREELERLRARIERDSDTPD